MKIRMWFFASLMAITSFAGAADAPTDQEAKARLEEMRREKVLEIKGAEDRLASLRKELANLANIKLASIKSQMLKERMTAEQKASEAQTDASFVWYVVSDRSSEKRAEWIAKIPAGSSIIPLVTKATLAEAEHHIHMRFEPDIIADDYTSYRALTPEYEVVVEVTRETGLISKVTVYPK